MSPSFSSSIKLDLLEFKVVFGMSVRDSFAYLLKYLLHEFPYLIKAYEIKIELTPYRKNIPIQV